MVSHDAFGVFWTSFRELEWKTPIFYGREVQKTPNASCIPRPRKGEGVGGAPSPMLREAARRPLMARSWRCT
jgi:hypothetical protein